MLGQISEMRGAKRPENREKSSGKRSGRIGADSTQIWTKFGGEILNEGSNQPVTASGQSTSSHRASRSGPVPQAMF